MKRGSATALFLVGAVGVAFAGCRQLLDVDGFGTRPMTDAGAGYIGVADGYSYVSASCRDCVDEHCRGPAVACGLDPSCAARARCLAACSAEDHACRGVCAVSTPGGALMNALTACEAEHCAESARARDNCSAALAVRGGIDCNRCLGERCRPTLEAFSRNPAALEYSQCRLDCTCQGDCPGGAPGCACDADADAMQLSSDFASCCPDACRANDPDWSCVGHVESLELPAAQPDLELQMHVVTPDNEKVPPLRVRACPPIAGGGAGCAGTATATTDAEGWVSLTVPGRSLSTLYFTHLYVTSDDPDYSAPALFYFFPPLVASPARVSRRMVSRALADLILSNNDLGIVADWEQNGGVVFSARSCNKNGRGIEVISKRGDRVLYFDDAGSPVADATATVQEGGIGFIANVTPGKLDLEARTDGKLVGEYSVLVMKGSLTHIALNPTELGDQ